MTRLCWRASSATSSVAVTDVAIAAGPADAHGPIAASPASACDSGGVACAEAAASAAVDPVGAAVPATSRPYMNVSCDAPRAGVKMGRYHYIHRPYVGIRVLVANIAYSHAWSHCDGTS